MRCLFLFSRKCFLFLILTAEALAGEPPTTGSIVGTVRGPDGSLLPGAVITATNSEASKTFTVVSGDHGGYRLSGLDLGIYQLQARLSGFETAKAPSVSVDGQKICRVDLTMRLMVLEQSLTVTSEAPGDSLELPRIRESSARDAGEALANMVGVWKIRRGAIANDLLLRGYQGENLNVLIDGQRLYGACPNNMDHAAFHVDFAEIERIEVDKGPFDLRNQGSLGGVVNIITRRPPKGRQIAPQLSFGSFGFINPSVSASYAASSWGILGGYSYRSSEPYRDGNGRKITETANYRTTALEVKGFETGTSWFKLEMVPRSDHLLQISFTRQDAGQIVYPYLSMDAGYDDAIRLNLRYEVNNLPGHIRSLRVQAYHNEVQHWMTDELRKSSLLSPRGYSMATMANASVSGGRIEAQFRELAFGLELFRRNWSTSTQMAMSAFRPQFSVPDVDVKVAGGFLDYSSSLTKDLRVAAGVRVDRVLQTADSVKADTSLYWAYHGTTSTTALDTSPSGRVRLSYSLPGNLALSGGIGHSVRMTDPQERFFALRRAGSDWVGNPGLDPTQANGLDLTGSYRHARFFLSGSVFRDALHNFVTVSPQERVNPVPGSMNGQARSYRNVDATLRGEEFEWVLSMTNRLLLSGDVSSVRGVRAASTGEEIRERYLSEIPPLRSRFVLRYDTQRERAGLFGEVETIVSAGQNHVDSELGETPTPGYSVFNLRVGGNIRRIRLVLGVANVLDRYYVEHLSYQRDPFRSGMRIAEPGRNLYGSLSFVF